MQQLEQQTKTLSESLGVAAAVGAKVTKHCIQQSLHYHDLSLDENNYNRATGLVFYTVTIDVR